MSHLVSHLCLGPCLGLTATPSADLARRHKSTCLEKACAHLAAFMRACCSICTQVTLATLVVCQLWPIITLAFMH